ncbi:uncharacterized protein LOC133806106 [Humulus lupulus]|uniref:uncharacterized protein LOC133806106 n=1 Tax=Humulus lupulus TaxID=3486 RepID=UPI002B4056DE|nr:uncharacterized protein LOC133806106 [Humulus lupulus]
MLNLIISLLSKELLTGENFPNWKSNINIVFIGDNSKFVMAEVCPDVPGDLSSIKSREKYEHWLTANNNTKDYMLASMSDTLRTKMEDVETAYEIMEQLQEMFGHKSRQARFEATKKYANVRTVPGMHVRDHFIKMMNCFQEAELHRATIDEETQVGLILNSLAPSFLPFTANYLLNKLKYGMTQLMNELQMFEVINGGTSKGHDKKPAAATEVAPIEANLASSLKSNKRNKRKNKKGKATTTAKLDGVAAKPAGEKPTAKKVKGACFHCKETRHWKRDCPTLTARGTQAT